MTHLECPPEPALSCLGQERDDARCDRIGIALAPFLRFHLGRLVGIAHVACFDQDGGILGEVETGAAVQGTSDALASASVVPIESCQRYSSGASSRISSSTVGGQAAAGGLL